MKKIMFAIQKGGTGKTTTTGNVGFELSKMGIKTLMIDFDAQGNLTSWLYPDEVEMEKELADYLLKEASLEEVIFERNENLFLLPTFSVNGQLRHFKKNVLDGRRRVFEIMFKEIEKNNFDIVLIDTSPALDNLEKRLLMETDEVISVVDNEIFSTDGLAIFKKEGIEPIKENEEIEIKWEKIVANKTRNLKAHKAHLEGYKEMTNFTIYQIENLKDVVESVFYQKTLSEYNPENKNIEVYKKIAKDLLKD